MVLQTEQIRKKPPAVDKATCAFYQETKTGGGHIKGWGRGYYQRGGSERVEGKR